MAKNKKILLIVGVALVAVLLAALAAILIFGGGEKGEKKPTGDMLYTVQVCNANEAPLADVGVYVYEDETKAELVWFDKTNAEGKMSFTAPVSDSYVAVLSDVPTGLYVRESYPITGELTKIILDAGVMTEEDMKTLTYKLGDMMLDFTIVDTEGKEYVLSELLKTKKAVILNFWYIECMPCKMEFPFMQEAYEEYKDKIEILAMNPVNPSEEDIAAFKKELGLTFPMAQVDELWAQIMQLTAYPTTVVIDRFGNITLIHKGSIDSAETFKQLFAYFTADDYEPKAIENLEDIVTEPEGSEDNPAEPYETEFDVTVGAGETYYMTFYKITEPVYLKVEGEGFILTYNGKEYKPSNGSVTITLKAEGPSTPVPVQIKNTTNKKQTYHFSKFFPKGSQANPYSLKLGEFDMSTSAGNEKGTFGTYTAEKEGTLTVRCLRSNVSKYGFHLYNLRSYAMRNTDEDGVVDEDGYKTVSVKVKKGDKVEFSVAVARDSNNNIAAGSFRFELILVEGDGSEDTKDTLPTQPYTITITDEAGNPIPNVAINIKGDFTYIPPVDETQPTEPTEPPTEPTEPEDPTKNEVKVDKNILTDETGVATTDLVPGPYIVTVSVPTEYKLARTEYELTDTVTELSIQMQKLQYKDYVVQVLDPDGAPVPNVVVLISSESSSVYGNTNDQGVYQVNQLEGDYKVSLYDGIPAAYASPADSFTFPEDSTTLQVKLVYKPGSVLNPKTIDGEGYAYTDMLTQGQFEYYYITNAAGMSLRILNESAVIYMAGTSYLAVDGMATAVLPDSNDPILVAVGNKSETPVSYRLNVGFPLGSRNNPVVLDQVYTYITTRGLNGGEEVWYSLTGVGGEALIISDPDAVIVYGDETYTAKDGAVTVELAEDAEPALVAFRNSGEQMEKYSVRVGYPWGHKNNPVTVNNKTTITTRALGLDDTVWYSMSGVAGMELTIEDENAVVTYKDKTYTAVDGVVNFLLDKDEEAALVSFANGGAVSESYTVRLKYPLGSEKNPIVYKGVFATFDTVQIPAGETVYYKVKNVGGATVTAGEQAQMVWKGSASQSVTIDDSDSVVSGILGIRNNTQEDKSFKVDVSFDTLGTRQNPKPYAGEMTLSLEAGDAEGYYFVFTADKSGTMTVNLSSKRGYAANTLSAGIDVTLIREGTSATPKMTDTATEDTGSKSVSIQVCEGDQVLILVTAEAATKKQNIAFTAAVALGEPAVDDVPGEGYVDPGEPYVEADDPNGKEEPTTYTEPPEIIEDEGDNQFLTYTVNVIDFTGKPMGNVIVQLYEGEKQIDGGMTNASGVFYTLQRPGDYAVKLSFSSSGCYYEDSIAVLSPSVTTLTIPVTTVLPTEGGTHWDTFQYQMVGMGGTYLSMQANVVNYFGFYPEQQGTYRFQVSDPNALISYWGNGYPNDLTENTLDYVGNAFTLSIGESMIGGTHFVGVTGVEDGILVITRLGDALFDVNELPWIPYVPEVAPAPVTNLPAGKTPVKVDLTQPSGTYQLVYNESDKYFHLGSANGPVMYVQLAADSNGNLPPYVHINAMVGGVDSSMATAFRWADYDDTGNYIKEDYTAVMIQMCDYAEANSYGVYPMTKDIVYMIQRCGTYMGWWEATNEKGNLLFKLEEGTLDPSINLDIAWMFACCYFQ